MLYAYCIHKRPGWIDLTRESFIHVISRIQSASTSAVVDPDLQKSGGGPGHPDPEIRGRGWGGGVVLGPGLTKKFFWPFGPQYKGVPPLLSLSPRFF